MIMRYIILFLLFIQINFSYAQSNSIYLHTDRDYYFPGDTVWFKGYILEEGLLSKNVFNLYLKWADGQGKEFQQAVAMVSQGITASHFVIPPTYQGDELFINAYTNDPNCPQGRPYFKKIGILQLGKPISDQRSDFSKKEKHYNLFLYPEGGLLLSDISNQLTIKCTDNNGIPSMAKGSLTDDQGKFLGDFQTDGAGLAMIYFTPNLATNYFIEWTAVDGNIRKNSLPAAKLGSKASLITENDQTVIQLQTNIDSQSVRIEASLQQRFLFKEQVHLIKGKKINIPLQNNSLEYGLLQVKVNDTSDQLLSSRTAIIGQEQILLKPEVSLQRGEGEKSGNRLQLQLPLKESAKLSISVTDIDVPIDSNESILTDLYLKPLASDNLIAPQVYWNKSKNRDGYIQSVNWLREICYSDKQFYKDTLLVLKGQIIMPKDRWAKFYESYRNLLKKEEKSKGVDRGASFGYQDFGSSRMKYQEIGFDSLGRFSIPNLIIFDSVETKFSQIYRRLKFEPFSVHYTFANPQQFRRPVYIADSLPQRDYKTTDLIQLESFAPNFTVDAKGQRRLATVVVHRSRLQREQERVQKRFYMADVPTNIKPDAIIYPALDSNVIKRSYDISDYIRKQLKSYNPQRNYKIYINGIEQIFTNFESNIDGNGLFEDAANFPMVKYYASLPQADNQPAILLFQSSVGEVDREIGKAVDKQTLMGYMPITQYTNVTYETTAKKFNSPKDYRSTLYWNAFATMEAGNTSGLFTFFNNSRAKGFCITIQGITESGKLVYYREIFK